MRICAGLILLLMLALSCSTSKDLSSHSDFHKRKYLDGKYHQSLIGKRKKAPVQTKKADPVHSIPSEGIALATEFPTKYDPENEDQNILSDAKITSLIDERRLTAMIKDSPFFDYYPRQKFKLPKKSRAADSIEKEDNTTGIIGFTLAMLSILSLILAGITGFSVFGVLAAVSPIAAFILGLVALGDFRREPDRYKGRGFALTAVIIGITYLALLLLAIILVALFASSWN